MITRELTRDLIRDEGVRKLPYVDSVGKVSIGIGRNLTDRGIRSDELFFMFKNDLAETYQETLHAFPWVFTLDQVRQDVIFNMSFNMGITTLKQFKRTLGSVENGDYDKAAKEMLESRWAKQVGPRAQRLAEMMRTGKR